MRIRAGAILGTTLVFSLAVGPVSRTATAASVVAYSFSGKILTVSQAATTNTGVVVGDPITGTFSYDSTQTGSGGIYTFTGSSKTHTLSFKIFNSLNQQIFTDQYTGNATLQAAGYYAAKVAYNGSTGTASLDLVGDTIYKQGLGQTFNNTGVPAYDLALTYPGSTGFSSTNLPLPNSTVIKNFVSHPGLLTWDPSDQTFTAGITSFTDLTVPEPSGLLLAIIGLSTCVLGSLPASRGRIGDPRPDRRAARW